MHHLAFAVFAAAWRSGGQTFELQMWHGMVSHGGVFLSPNLLEPLSTVDLHKALLTAYERSTTSAVPRMVVLVSLLAHIAYTVMTQSACHV
jgi:hypothetical protein